MRYLLIVPTLALAAIQLSACSTTSSNVRERAPVVLQLIDDDDTAPIQHAENTAVSERRKRFDAWRTAHTID